MRKAQLLTAVTLLSTMPLAACYVSSSPPPQNQGGYAYTDPPPPPPPQQEAPPPPPPEGQTWVAGAQRWNGHGYEWQAGHYERPPRANARHVEGHWEQHGRQKTWVEAHWE